MSLFTKLKVLLGLQRAYDDAVEAAQKVEVEMEPTKSLWTSKTLWFNLLLGIYNVAEMNGLIALIPAPWGVVVQTVGNVILRGITTEPVRVVPKALK